MSRRPRSLMAAMLTGSLLLAPAASWAQSKQACIDAHLAAQVDRDEGRLRGAREKFLVCAAEACPSAVRVDCAEALAQVLRDLPSVVFTGKDASGKSLAGLTVREGATLVVEGKDGAAIPMDPGSHHFEATLANGQRATADAVVRTGDRNLPVLFTFSPTSGVATTPSPAPAPAPNPRTDTPSRPVPLLTWVFGGASLAGLGVFTGFGLSGRSTQSSFDSCKPNCAQTDYDSMKRSYLVADIGLLVGIASAGLATYFYATRPESSAR